jgi:hypothetical protein
MSKDFRDGADVFVAGREMKELEEIWRATLRAERRILGESLLLGLVALASAVCLSLSLYAIYGALGGMN